MRKSIEQSLTEYILSLGRWGWAVAVGIIFAVTGAYLDISGKAGIPTWAWLALLLLILVLVPFITFHKLRISRDELQTKLDIRRRRLQIRDVLGEYYKRGVILRQRVSKKEGNARELHKEWILPLNEFLRSNDELGEITATLLNIVNYDETFIPNIHNLDNDEYTAYVLFEAQLMKLRELIREFQRS